MNRGTFRAIIVGAALCLGSEGTAWALEFTAERTTRVDGQSRKASLYYRDEMWRVEYYDGGAVNAMIIRKDKGLTWLLMARMKQFKTVAYEKEYAPKLSEQLDGEIARQEIGREPLYGHPTIVYRVTVRTASGSTEVYYQWLAMDLGLPLRLASKDRDWLTEYTDVRLTSVSDFMFRPPRDYQPVAETVAKMARPSPIP
jgi:hypothetical protein